MECIGTRWWLTGACTPNLKPAVHGHHNPHLFDLPDAIGRLPTGFLFVRSSEVFSAILGLSLYLIGTRSPALLMEGPFSKYIDVMTSSMSIYKSSWWTRSSFHQSGTHGDLRSLAVIGRCSAKRGVFRRHLGITRTGSRFLHADCILVRSTCQYKEWRIQRPFSSRFFCAVSKTIAKSRRVIRRTSQLSNARGWRQPNC